MTRSRTSSLPQVTTSTRSRSSKSSLRSATAVWAVWLHASWIPSPRWASPATAWALTTITACSASVLSTTSRRPSPTSGLASRTSSSRTTAPTPSSLAILPSPPSLSTSMCPVTASPPRTACAYSTWQVSTTAWFPAAPSTSTRPRSPRTSPCSSIRMIPTSRAVCFASTRSTLW